MKKILDHIFFMRPLLILSIWTIAILGARAGQLGAGGNPLFITRNSSEIKSALILSLLLSALLYAAVYIYNQIHDIASDRENHKLFFMAEKIISEKMACVMAIILGVASLIGAFLISFSMGLIFTTIAVMGFLYSYPPTDFKGKAGKALWTNMMGAGSLPFLIGWVAATGHLSLEGILKSMPYLMAVGAIYLNTTLPDREGDKKTGKNTFGVLWPVERSQRSALFRICAAALFAQMAGDFAMLICALLSLPFFIRAAVTKNIADSMLATKVSIVLLSVFASVFMPPFLVILLVIFLATRFYYKWRFNLAYPTLK